MGDPGQSKQPSHAGSAQRLCLSTVGAPILIVHSNNGVVAEARMTACFLWRNALVRDELS